MKQLTVVFLFLISFCYANEIHSEKIVSDKERIYIISSFEEIDYFTTVSHDGKVLWEVSFAAQIISWTLEEEKIFVFSKARNGRAFYLACIDLETGVVKWGTRILPPQFDRDIP